MREPAPPEERGTAPLAHGYGGTDGGDGGGGGGAADGGLAPSSGTSEADIIGLTAVGAQFGLAGIQAAHATHDLATGPLRAPGLLLALAMDGDAGWAAFGRMQSLAFLRGADSLAGAAAGLAADAVVLEGSAIRFMVADSGFLTDPLLTVPLSEAEGVAVERTVRFQLDGDVTIRGVELAAGTALVVEYLANGRVRVSLDRSFGAGAEVRADSGLGAGGEAVTGMSWLMANDREAARLVTALTAVGGASLATGIDLQAALALSGATAPIPRPQTTTLAQGASLEASFGSDHSLGGASPWGTGSLGELELAGQGQVTFAEDGSRTYALQLDARGSTGLRIPALDDLRAHLPGGNTHIDPNILEAAGGGTLEVKTDAQNTVQEVSVAFRGELGQGSGLSTDVVSGSSTAGASSEVKLTLSRQDLEAAGADGRRVLAALANNRPDEAADALTRLVERGKIDVTDHDYVRISGGIEAQRGVEGLSAGGEVTIETTR